MTVTPDSDFRNSTSITEGQLGAQRSVHETGGKSVTPVPSRQHTSESAHRAWIRVPVAASLSQRPTSSVAQKGTRAAARRQKHQMSRGGRLVAPPAGLELGWRRSGRKHDCGSAQTPPPLKGKGAVCRLICSLLQPFHTATLWICTSKRICSLLVPFLFLFY